MNHLTIQQVKDLIVLEFEKSLIGDVKRIDFIPVGVDNQVNACIHLEYSDSPLAKMIKRTLDNGSSFRMYLLHTYENSEEHYWTFVKCTNPIPDTAMNIHQIANTCVNMAEEINYQGREIVKLQTKQQEDAAKIFALEKQMADVCDLLHKLTNIEIEPFEVRKRSRANPTPTLISEDFEIPANLMEVVDSILKIKNMTYTEHKQYFENYLQKIKDFQIYLDDNYWNSQSTINKLLTPFACIESDITDLLIVFSDNDSYFDTQKEKEEYIRDSYKKIIQQMQTIYEIIETNCGEFNNDLYIKHRFYDLKLEELLSLDVPFMDSLVDVEC